MEVVMKYKLTIGKILKHFHLINKHRFIVFKLSIRAGVPLQGLVHDLSKYSFAEFFEEARYYAGTYSPIKNAIDDMGYSKAWLHHKGRNKHHFEYWIDYAADGDGNLAGMKMPDKYIIEMFMDRIAASKVYMKEKYTDRSPLEYYNRGKGKILLHEHTKELLEMCLEMLAEQGEEKCAGHYQQGLADFACVCFHRVVF